MLKQRVITACIMVTVLLLLLFLAPPLLFQGAIFLLCALAAWEWTCLAAFSSLLGRVLYVLALTLTLALVALSTVTYPALVAIILAPAVLGWCIALGLVLTYPAYRQWCQKPVLAFVGVWLLLPCFYAVLYLKSIRSDSGLVLLVIAIIAAADTGAYFVGRRFGRRKLSPAVSPGKTWEGFFGGMLASGALAVFVGAVSAMPFLSPTLLLGMCISAAVSSVVGDLFESLIKRERGVKDSGQILPGHGGILDRLDGWLAAFPVFALLYWWVGA